MKDVDENYFLENIIKVNKTVECILAGASLVPVAFMVLSLVDVWRVPHSYSISLFVTTLVFIIVMHLLRVVFKAPKAAMYWGILSTCLFVAFLGAKGFIAISISYAFGPMLSCMYYNRTITRVTCILSFLILLAICYLRSYTNLLVTEGIQSRTRWFIQNLIGYIIESVFLFLITDGVSARIQKALQNLTSTVDDRNKAFVALQERNEYIVSMNTELELKNQKLDDTQYKIIQFVAKCLGSHDLFTGRHVIHTQKYVEVICKELLSSGYYKDELTEKNIRYFQTAAFLHDIGKIHIPEGILNKIGKFTPEEFVMMKCHPEEGKKLLEYLPPIDDGEFNEIAMQMAYCHHEKWDGSGYPNGISGEKIPLAARIMAAADVLDALISQRLYKEPMSVDEAMDVFRKSSGSHFEPCIAEAVIKNRNVIELIDTNFKTMESTTNAQELEWWQNYHNNLQQNK